MTEQRSVYLKNIIPGQWGHPGPFRDKGMKFGSVPDVPGRLATMTYKHRGCILVLHVPIKVCYIGVRAETMTETGETHAQPAWMSMQPPAKFSKKTDWHLWVIRFEGDTTEAKILRNNWGERITVCLC